MLTSVKKLQPLVLCDLKKQNKKQLIFIGKKTFAFSIFFTLWIVWSVICFRMKHVR